VTRNALSFHRHFSRCPSSSCRLSSNLRHRQRRLPRGMRPFRTMHHSTCCPRVRGICSMHNFPWHPSSTCRFSSNLCHCERRLPRGMHPCPILHHLTCAGVQRICSMCHSQFRRTFPGLCGHPPPVRSVRPVHRMCTLCRVYVMRHTTEPPMCNNSPYLLQ